MILYSHARVIAYGFPRKMRRLSGERYSHEQHEFYNHKLNLTSNFSLSIKDRLVYIFLYVPRKEIQSIERYRK